MKKLLTLILLTISFSITAQKKYYNNAVNNCSGSTSTELIECIKGTTLLNYDFTDINGKTISTDEVKKPIFIITAATWSAPFRAAINHDKVEFIMIFWGRGLNNMASKINKKANIIPAKDSDKVENGNIDISGFVHRLKDNPTGYLINKNKIVIDVARGAASPSKTMTWEEASKLNLEKINGIVNQLLQ